MTSRTSSDNQPSVSDVAVLDPDLSRTAASTQAANVASCRSRCRAKRNRSVPSASRGISTGSRPTRASTSVRRSPTGSRNPSRPPRPDPNDMLVVYRTPARESTETPGNTDTIRGPTQDSGTAGRGHRSTHLRVREHASPRPPPRVTRRARPRSSPAGTAGPPHPAAASATGGIARASGCAGRDTATTRNVTRPSSRRTTKDSSPRSGCTGSVPYAKPKRSASSTTATIRHIAVTHPTGSGASSATSIPARGGPSTATESPEPR